MTAPDTPSREELLTLADEEAAARARYHETDARLIRESEVLEYALRLAAEPADDDVREALPEDIRALGWTVAVHNDYRQLDEPHTFWLFTKDGLAVKGEGMSDAEALNKVRKAIRALSTKAKP